MVRTTHDAEVAEALTMYASFCGAHGGAREIEGNRRHRLIAQFSNSDFEVRVFN